jgi:hypothetical protein
MLLLLQVQFNLFGECCLRVAGLQQPSAATV